MKSQTRTTPIVTAALLLLSAVGVVASDGTVESMSPGGPGSGPCDPMTCEDLGVECGVWFDGCRRDIDCGTCDEGMTCVEGQCVEGEYWAPPTCGHITGASEVTYTTDEGLTLAKTPRLSGVNYTFGLACLSVPGKILASTLTQDAIQVLQSEDAGCNWTELRELPVGMPLMVTPAPNGGAYAWSLNATQLYRVTGSAVKLMTAPAKMHGLAVDPDNAAHIRAGTQYCQLYESYDYGFSWSSVGYTVESCLTYTVDFDSTDWGDALCGCANGAWRTTDHGSSWVSVPPVNPEWGASDVVFRFARSPADSQRVWAEANVAIGTLDKHPMILVSDDAGASFVPVVEQYDTATDQNGVVRTVLLPNGTLIVAHPEQPDVLYFVFGSYVEEYGTDLYRYDHGTGALDVVHIDGLDSIDAIAFNPADADVMYLGLESED